ncbi:MAG: M42 family metallopeptidase [Lawsonibacter sp.]
MEYEQVLTRLCAPSGPSGFESTVVQVAANELRPFVDNVSIDRMGNLIGVRFCGKKGAKKLLLDAHLDEIGFIITGHEEGFLRFAPLGGVDPRMLPDRELTILTQPPTIGVVACLPPHIQTREDMDRAQPIKELYLDVGLSQENAQVRIPVGTPAVYRGSCMKLGEDLICGAGLDDRAGFAVLLDVMEQLAGRPLNVDIYVLGSTQEETHSTGAITAAYSVAPDCCVAVDVTHGDTPDASKEKTFSLGGGPVLGMGPNCTDWMVERLKKSAQKLDIEVQTEVMAGHSGTNGWPLQVSREGVATAVVSLPLRYMHTPVETVHCRDLQQTAQLLVAFLSSIEEDIPEL